VCRSRSRRTAAQTESFGLRNQRGSKRTEVSPESDRRARSPQTRGIRSPATAFRPGAPRAPQSHHRTGCRCPPVFSDSTHVHHALWGALLVCSRLGAAEAGCLGPSRAFAGIEDDPGGSRFADLPGVEAVVDRASQSRDGAGSTTASTPGLALFAGLNAFPKKSYLSEYSSRIP